MKVGRIGWRRAAIVLAVVGALLPAGQTAWAQEENGGPQTDKNWSNEAELGYINTSGNSATTSLSFGNRFTYNFTYAELTFKVDLFRATARQETLTNVGGGVRVDSETRTTGERYRAELKYRQNIVGELFWFGIGSWYRNRPAGLDTRWLSGAGFGTRLLNNDRTVLSVEFGGGLTREERLDGVEDTFVDLRAYAAWDQKLGASADISVWSEALLDIQHAENLRINSHAEVTSHLTGRLSMRLWWDVQFDNDPTAIVVATNPDEPPALHAFRTTDRTLGVSLVVDF